MAILTIVSGSLFGAQAPEIAKRQTADKLRAIVYHAEGRLLICDSDLRADLSDTVPTLRDAIIKELILLDAKKLKIPVSEAEIDRYLARVQEQLSMTRQDLIVFFKERGYTFEQAKRELEKNLLVESTIDARVKSKAFVPKSEIEKYYKDHPIILYELKQAFVPFGGGLKALTRTSVDTDIESRNILQTVLWNDAGIIHEKDITQPFVKTLPEGSITKLEETEAGIPLLHIVSKKEVPFEKRMQEIQQLLGRDRFMKAIDQYYAKLLSEAQVRYIDSSDAPTATAPAA
jgi:hypothetical protein